MTTAGNPRQPSVFRVVLYCILGLGMGVALGCADGSRKQQITAPAPTPLPIVEPINDGNGVFYFEATGEQYRRSLAKFYENNPGRYCDLQGHTELVNIYGVATSGFILHCRDIAVDAQDVTVP